MSNVSSPRFKRMSAQDPVAENVFSLINAESVPALITPNEWSTPFDSYAQFINISKLHIHPDQLQQYIQDVYHVNTIEEALTPTVMFQLATEELLELRPPK